MELSGPVRGFLYFYSSADFSSRFQLKHKSHKTFDIIFFISNLAGGAGGGCSLAGPPLFARLQWTTLSDNLGSIHNGGDLVPLTIMSNMSYFFRLVGNLINLAERNI